MELELLKGLLTAEQLRLAEEPLSRSERKQKFLKVFLKNNCEVVSTLKLESVEVVELLVWRKCDEAFEYLFGQYERLVNADFAASLRKDAKGSDSLATKVAVLQTIAPEYDRAVTKEKTKATLAGKGSSAPNPADYATFAAEELVDPLEAVKDPLALVGSRLIEDMKMPAVPEYRAPVARPEEGPIELLVRDSQEHLTGTEFVQFFQPKAKAMIESD